MAEGGGVGFRIEAIHAYVAVHDDGDEGVVGLTVPGLGLVPAIAADPARLDQLRPLVQEIARVTPTPIKLVRFENRVEVETVEPPPQG